MKKSTKLILSALGVVVTVIVVIAVTSPSVFTGNSSGTMVADDGNPAYQMTERDIALKNQLSGDTAALRQMVEGLVSFSVFTTNLGARIEKRADLLQEGLNRNQDARYSQIAAMKDYSAFVRKNNDALMNTIRLLNGFSYPAKGEPESVEVERCIREFGLYVKNLTNQDQALENALAGMDNPILGDEFMKGRTNELARIQSIRDQMINRGIQF